MQCLISIVNSILSLTFYYVRDIATKTPEIAVFTHPVLFNGLARTDPFETAVWKLAPKATG